MKGSFTPGHWHLLDLSIEPFNQNVVENHHFFSQPPCDYADKVTQHIVN